ncbi:hypothetical protein [Acinetobacter wuhouensis]|uniref:hypothetical protein n=1 Tax=Acinetobacter wuhouensis TaxID=1879050 RepID=UPI002076EADD|nr:hypothetical protein [Acinetobacter wuhouensis]
MKKKIMHINQKFQTLILSVFLLSAQNIYAKSSEIDRVNTIAQSMIGTFSNESNQAQFSVKMTAAMEGVPENEIQKRFDESGEKPISTSEKMFEMLKQQYNVKDLKVIAPAFQKQMEVQGTVYNSCQLSGKPIKKQQTYEVPVTCNVPVINFSTIQVPKKSAKESDAQYMAKVISLSSDHISKAPREALKTSILIHRQADQLIPEMDDPNYFPDTVTNKMTGTTEEELNQENAK